MPGPAKLQSIPRYSVFEQTFDWNSTGYSNPWEQVTVSMTLMAPNGRPITVGGFYYAPNTWKARFAPAQTGDWSWQTVISDGTKAAKNSGRFSVGESDWPGFVRSNPNNKFRWVFDNGASYSPIGIGDCINDTDKNGSPLDDWGFDGVFRPAGQELGRQTDIDTYLKAFSGAGVNLFRWSVNNCAFNLYQKIEADGNAYFLDQGRWGDQLVQKLRQYGLRTYMVLFSSDPPGGGAKTPHQASHQAPQPTPLHAAQGAAQYEAVKRYVKYVVDRYGAYVDFWELANEATVSDEWYGQVTPYLRSIDPYQHAISTSWEKPNLAGIDIDSPHWYQKESEFASDQETWQRFAEWKTANKPVIVGEQGNQVQNWDEQSGLRMRLRSWTAFFAEGVLVFWNTSSAKDYRNSDAANIYLGPAERSYLKVLQDFTRGFDPRARITTVQVNDSNRVRGYALTAPGSYTAYMHAFTNHSSATTGISVAVEPQAAGSAVWIEPASGRVLGMQAVPAGRQTLSVPAFVIDAALKISSAAP